MLCQIFYVNFFTLVHTHHRAPRRFLQSQQLRLDVHKLQLRSWKILEGSCGCKSFRHFAQKIPLSAAKICEFC